MPLSTYSLAIVTERSHQLSKTTTYSTIYGTKPNEITFTKGLDNPYIISQTTSQFPQHFHSLGYTSCSLMPVLVWAQKDFQLLRLCSYNKH